MSQRWPRGLQRETMTSKGAPLPLDLGPYLVLPGLMVSKGVLLALDLGPPLARDGPFDLKPHPALGAPWSPRASLALRAPLASGGPLTLDLGPPPFPGVPKLFILGPS